ncbi:hypothetical protein [Brevibacterium sp.]|uniref:hypothetical protein n=1 Tax=Brevibacterium sp. TaxID=1701 RepID=UPI0025B90210|nr:hypothetical protein [Brevibacterium sp.]
MARTPDPSKPDVCEHHDCSRSPVARWTSGDGVVLWVCKTHHYSLSKNAQKNAATTQMRAGMGRQGMSEEERKNALAAECSYREEGGYRCRRIRTINIRKDNPHPGYCSLHQGFLLQDDVQSTMRAVETIASKIVVNDAACWIINTGDPEKPRFEIDTTTHRGWLAYKLMYLWFVERPKEDARGHLRWGYESGKVLGHICLMGENPRCVNPLHVMPITPAQNRAQQADPVMNMLVGGMSQIGGAPPALREWADAHGLPLHPIEDDRARGLVLDGALHRIEDARKSNTP